MADIEAIKARYPAYAFLLDDPEIGALLNEAVDNGMDEQTFQAKLMATNWWKTHGDAQRSWYALVNTDPAQAEAKKNETRGQIRQIIGQSNLNLDDGAIEWLTINSLTLGVDPSSAMFKEWLAQSWDKPGIAANTIPTLRGIAERDYMVPVDDRTLAWWTGQMAAGYKTEQNFRTMLSELAASRYSGFADRITNGETPGAIFGSYKATIAQELEYGSPDQVNLMSDPRWSQVTGVVGGDDKIRPMTLAETIKLARSQEEWKATRNGQAVGANLTQSLLKTFGQI